MKAAKDAATAVDEQTTSGVQQLVRTTFVEESAFEEYYKGNKDYESWFNKKVPVAIKGAQKIGYWVKGILNDHLDGHSVFQHFETGQVTVTKRHEDGSCALTKSQVEDKFKSIAQIWGNQQSVVDSSMGDGKGRVQWT